VLIIALCRPAQAGNGALHFAPSLHPLPTSLCSKKNKISKLEVSKFVDCLIIYLLLF